MNERKNSRECNIGIYSSNPVSGKVSNRNENRKKEEMKKLHCERIMVCKVIKPLSTGYFRFASASALNS